MQRCTASLPGLRRGRLIAAYAKVRLIPRDLRALPLELFTRSSNGMNIA